MNIQEGNKIIAEFIGWSLGKANDDRWQDAWFNPAGIRMTRKNEPLLFHSEWDWIIPVIQLIGYETGYELVIRNEEAYWDSFGDYPPPSGFLGYGHPIEDGVWVAVVEFIKWHQNKEK